MNSREFRAVLDWWIASDPFPQLPQITVDEWLHNESVQRGYLGIIDAYHNHEADVSTAPSSPGLPPEQASGPVPEAGFDPERHRDAGPSATSAGGDEPSARPLSDAALGRLGQAMLADYVTEHRMPSRGEIAMRALQGILAHSYNDASYEGAARDAVVYADALLAALSKEPRT